MTGGDVSGSDMPNFSWPVGRDVSAVEDAALAAILAGSDLPAGAAAGLRPVADVLAALRAGPASDELSGLGATQAEFRRRIGRPARPGRSRGRRPARLPSLLSAKQRLSPPSRLSAWAAPRPRPTPARCPAPGSSSLTA